MKKIISIVLVMMLLLTCFVGCSSKKGTDETNTVNTGETGEVPYNPAIDTLYYEGLDLTFYYANVGGAPRNEFFAEEWTGDAISDKIYARNMATEEKFGIKLVFKSEAGVAQVDDIKEKYLAQDTTYDIIAPYAYYGVGLTAEGAFANLNELEYLDTGSSWWSQSYVDAINYNGRLYSIAGDLNTSVTTYTMATFVNTDMLENFKPEEDIDLISVVENGEWTLEYMMNMCKNVYQEDDSVGDRSDGDKYGLILGQISQPAESLLVSFGFKWTETDAKGGMNFILNDHTNVDILSELETLYNSKEEGIYKMAAEGDFAESGAGHYITLFSKGKTMVAMAPLFTAEKIVDTDISYLLLPLPKRDTNQTEYRTATMDCHCNITVSAMSDAKEAAGAVLEYMGYLSEKDVTPQYFGISYGNRFASDYNTMRLFDTVIDSVKFDFARTYSRSLGDVTQKMRGLVANSLDIGSSVTGYQRTCQGFLKILQTKMDKMGG